MLIVFGSLCYQTNSSVPDKSALLTISNFTDPKWRQVDASKLRYIKIDPGATEQQFTRNDQSDLERLVGSSPELESIWLSREVLSSELIKQLVTRKKLKFVLIVDPPVPDYFSNGILGINTLEKLVLVYYETKIRESHTHPLIDEVEMAKDSAYFDSNGCVKTAFLESRFGLKLFANSSQNKR